MIIFGDSHVHSFNPIFGNNCLHISVDPFVQLRRYMIEHNESNAVYLGDLTHLKDRVPTAVWNALFDEFMLWKEANLDIILLKGNHDFQNMDVFIKSFGNLGNVIPILKPCILNIDGYSCYFSPFGFNDCSFEPMRRSTTKKILFLHDHINNVDYGYKYWTGVSKKFITSYEYVFAGHWHKFMEVEKGRVWHLGSPYQTNFAEVGQEKYFAIIKNNKVKFEQFKYPELVQINLNQLNKKSVVKDKYVKIIIKAASLLDVNVRVLKKELMEKYGALGVIMDMTYTPKEKRKITNVSDSKIEDVDYIGAYVKEKNDGLDIKLLTELGTKILKGT